MRSASHRIFPLGLDSLPPLRRFRAVPVLQLAALSLFAAPTGCGGSGSSSQFSYENVTLSVSPQVTSVPVNSTVTFTATTTNEPNDPEWILLGYAYANLGSPSVSLGSPTFVYTAPPTPPIYTPMKRLG
jgi:hypothetical protein